MATENHAVFWLNVSCLSVFVLSSVVVLLAHFFDAVRKNFWWLWAKTVGVIEAVWDEREPFLVILFALLGFVLLFYVIQQVGAK